MQEGDKGVHQPFIELSQNNRHGSALENKTFERIHTHYAYLSSRLGKSFKNYRNNL